MAAEVVMKPSLLDTDIFSEVLKGRNSAVAAAAKNYRAGFGHYTISAITVMEIVAGVQKRQPGASVKRFWELLDAAVVLEFDRSAANIAGRIVADLERAGTPIGGADPMIASIALDQGLVLVTANTDHFEHIQTLGYPLEIENWRTG